MPTSTLGTEDETVRRLRLRLRRGELEEDGGDTANTTSSSPLAATASILEGSLSSSVDGTYSPSSISVSSTAEASAGTGGSATGVGTSTEAGRWGGTTGSAGAAAEAEAEPGGLAAEPRVSGAVPAAGIQALVHSRA